MDIDKGIMAMFIALMMVAAPLVSAESYGALTDGEAGVTFVADDDFTFEGYKALTGDDAGVQILIMLLSSPGLASFEYTSTEMSDLKRFSIGYAVEVKDGKYFEYYSDDYEAIFETTLVFTYPMSLPFDGNCDSDLQELKAYLDTDGFEFGDKVTISGSSKHLELVDCETQLRELSDGRYLVSKEIYESTRVSSADLEITYYKGGVGEGKSFELSYDISGTTITTSVYTYGSDPSPFDHEVDASVVETRGPDDIEGSIDFTFDGADHRASIELSDSTYDTTEFVGTSDMYQVPEVDEMYVNLFFASDNLDVGELKLNAPEYGTIDDDMEAFDNLRANISRMMAPDDDDGDGTNIVLYGVIGAISGALCVALVSIILKRRG